MKDYHILIAIFMILGFVLNVKISKKVSFLNNTYNLNKYKTFKVKRNKYIKIYNSKNDKSNKFLFDEYDENCIKALIMAREVAKNNNENEVLLKHLLVAIIKTDSNIIEHIFKYFNISLQHFINKFNTETDKDNIKKTGQESYDHNPIQSEQIDLQKCNIQTDEQENKFINNKQIKDEEYNHIILNNLNNESNDVITNKDDNNNNTDSTSNENYDSEKVTDISNSYNNNNVDANFIANQNKEDENKQNDEMLLVNNNSTKRNNQKVSKPNKEIKFSENCKLVLQNAILEARKKNKIFVNLTDILISMINIAQENKECDFVKYLNELNISLSDLKKQINNYDENNLSSTLIHSPFNKNTIQNDERHNNEHEIGNPNGNHYPDKQNRNMSDQPNNIINNMNNEYINQEKYFKNNEDNNFPQNNKFMPSVITKDCLVDLVQRAYEKRLDTFFGRQDEIKRIIEILGRKKKSNPLLVGETGVGKTAIVEQLAYLILKNKVPYHLKNCKIFQLNLGNIVAGTKYRGEFEEKMKQILANISKDKKNILFIDEIHVIVGAGSGEGSLDASNILKPFLSSDNLQCIGTTTFQEYSKYIETDKALRRRFNCVNIKPLNSNETYKLLKKIKNSYEQYHNIYYTNEALKSIILLSDDYLPTLNFPDKAIDILDEAGSYQKIKYERYITKKLRNENNIKTDPAKVEEKTDINKTDTINTESNQVENNSTDVASHVESNYLVDDLHMKYVTSDVIENIVSKKSSISFIKKNKKEEEKIQNLKEKLNKIIIGQEKVIDILSKYLFKAITNIKDANKPIGTLLLCGSSGVGKTLCAQVISQYLFNDDNIIVINMNEYIDKHSVSKLFGSYPGYVGYKEGGELTEAVKKKPFSIILFDEIEKAHSDVLHVLLQILDNGILTDSKGNKVSFKNTFIFMTTNVGSDIITDYFKVYNKNYANFGFKYYIKKEKNDKVELRDTTNTNTHNGEDKIQTDLDIFEEKIKTNKWYDELQPEIEEELKKKFLPEFLNRIDEKILFRQFLKRDIIQILENMIEDLKKRIKKRKKLNILIDDNIIKYICSDENNIYDINFGARSIRRALYKYIEDPIAAFLISNEYEPNDTMHLTLSPTNKINVNLLKHTITSLS
ncbi:ATP-dependent Clp protease, protease subunit [Plasmodium vinckei petteri]|uniref:ATP-dependent Clp protease, protease subunit n=1 Tax=Plasmodium vinckei petteri TaxID=138298 RepID=W7AP61_PLAVN|nr:ATP-dependent Clp protease, protease subunit [Plasmodium vinckei petteri]CAD2107477.1 ATP-dependent Clp protease, putative [Plasmodium vinckei petteri]